MAVEEIRHFTVAVDAYGILRLLHDPMLLDSMIAAATGGTFDELVEHGRLVGYVTRPGRAGAQTAHVHFGDVDDQGQVLILSRDLYDGPVQGTPASRAVWLLSRREGGVTIDERVEFGDVTFESELVYVVAPNEPDPDSPCELTVGASTELVAGATGARAGQLAAAHAARRADASALVTTLEWVDRRIMEQFDTT